MPVQVGVRVRVPVRTRSVVGWVVAVRSGPSARPLRAVEAVLDREPLLGEEDLALARWVAWRYLAPLGRVLPLFLPPGQRSGRARTVGERLVAAYRLAVPPEEARAALKALGRAPRQRAALELLLDRDGGPVTARELAGRAGGGAARSLLARGLITATA